MRKSGKEILWAEPGKQKERVVQGAGITPEAVPSKGQKERMTGDCQRESWEFERDVGTVLQNGIPRPL